MIERHLVAEEEGLVGGHGLYHLRDKGSRASPHLLHEFGNPRQAGLARQRNETAFDQILLVGSQIETGLILQELSQVLIIWRCHARPHSKHYKHWYGSITRARRPVRFPGTWPRRCPCRTAS